MRAGRILAAILLLGGLIGVLVGAGEIYTRLLIPGYLVYCRFLGVDTSFLAWGERQAPRSFPARQCGGYVRRAF